MEIHRSGRKHGISDDTLCHAFDNALVQLDFDTDEHPPRYARPHFLALLDHLGDNS